jgi:hypothetical protein
VEWIWCEWTCRSGRDMVIGLRSVVSHSTSSFEVQHTIAIPSRVEIRKARVILSSRLKCSKQCADIQRQSQKALCRSNAGRRQRSNERRRPHGVSRKYYRFDNDSRVQLTTAIEHSTRTGVAAILTR